MHSKWPDHPLPSQGQPSERHQASRERLCSSPAPFTTPLILLPLEAKEQEMDFSSHGFGNISKMPLGSPHHIPAATLVKHESDAGTSHPPTHISRAERCLTVASVPASPLRWFLWGCDPARAGLHAACGLAPIAAGAMPIMVGASRPGKGKPRPNFPGGLGVCKAWTVQIVQKWGQQRALRYHCSPTGPSPQMGNRATPKALQPFSALPWV